MLLEVTTRTEGSTICALGDAAVWPIQCLIRRFHSEIQGRIYHYRAGKHHVQRSALIIAK